MSLVGKMNDAYESLELDLHSELAAVVLRDICRYVAECGEKTLDNGLWFSGIRYVSSIALNWHNNVTIFPKARIHNTPDFTFNLERYNKFDMRYEFVVIDTTVFVPELWFPTEHDVDPFGKDSNGKLRILSKHGNSEFYEFVDRLCIEKVASVSDVDVSDFGSMVDVLRICDASMKKTIGSYLKVAHLIAGDSSLDDLVRELGFEVSDDELIGEPLDDITRLYRESAMEQYMGEESDLKLREEAIEMMKETL